MQWERMEALPSPSLSLAARETEARSGDAAQGSAPTFASLSCSHRARLQLREFWIHPGECVTFPSLEVNLGMKVGDRASAFLSFSSASQRLSLRAMVPTLRDDWGGGRVATGDGPSQAPWLHSRAGREVSALRRPVPRWPGDPLASLPALPFNARQVFSLPSGTFHFCVNSSSRWQQIPGDTTAAPATVRERTLRSRRTQTRRL